MYRKSSLRANSLVPFTSPVFGDWQKASLAPLLRVSRSRQVPKCAQAHGDRDARETLSRIRRERARARGHATARILG